MTNNDIFKKIRVALSLKDTDIIDILKLEDFEMTKSELSALFRKEDHPNYQECGDQVLRKFLNGLITKMRGPKPEKVKLAEAAEAAKGNAKRSSDRSKR